jgi:GNAT superfamily N-acetyltransferase
VALISETVLRSIDRHLETLRRLEPTDSFFVRAAELGGEVVTMGPFRAIFSRGAENVWLNQAMPYEPLGSREEIIAWLRQLRRLFEERHRRPAVEFNEPLWPELPELLEIAGFVDDEREPLMLCAPVDFHPIRDPDVVVRFLCGADADAELAAYRQIFTRVMEVDLWRSTEDVRAEVERLEARCLALATLHGRPVGTGFISSSDGVAEITRMATLPEARRRGVAATLTTFMAQDRFGAGDTLVWLTAQTPPAKALYQKLGFRLIGERCYFRVDPCG